MIVKREFDETCEVVYDTSDNSVIELYSGKEYIEETTKEEIMEMLQ